MAAHSVLCFCGQTHKIIPTEMVMILDAISRGDYVYINSSGSRIECYQKIVIMESAALKLAEGGYKI